MFTLTASATDIEHALNELHQLASTGELSDARHAGEFLMALHDGHSHPLNLQDFASLCPLRMRQAMQLLTFLMLHGSPLNKFIGEEAMDQVKANLRNLQGGFKPTPKTYTQMETVQ